MHGFLLTHSLAPLTRHLFRATTAFASTSPASSRCMGGFQFSNLLLSGRQRAHLHANATNVTESAVDPPALEPSNKIVKAALCQVAVCDDKAANIQRAGSLIAEAAQQGARLVVLPEIWNSPYSNDSFPKYAEEISPANLASGSAAPSYEFMSRAAREHNIVLVGGSIPTRKNDKLYNTCFVFDTTGDLLGSYSKLHLFDIDIPGKITFKESDTLTGGEGLTVIDTELGRIGLGICYDIRFPELAALYAARGVQILVYPGAFNTTTGPLHWELLQRARAVDNQLFVLTCSPARDEKGGYVRIDTCTTDPPPCLLYHSTALRLSHSSLALSLSRSLTLSLARGRACSFHRSRGGTVRPSGRLLRSSVRETRRKESCTRTWTSENWRRGEPTCR